MNYVLIKEHYDNSEATVNHYMNQINILERSIEDISRELDLCVKEKKSLQDNQERIIQEYSHAKLQTETVD